MRIGMAAFVMLVLAAGSAAQAQDCPLKRYESLALEVSPDFLLLPVTFGTVPKKMAFRLEDAANAIVADTAKELDLHLTSMPPNITFHRDGQEVTQIARAPEVYIGRLALKNMEFLLIHPARYPEGVAGDIGTRMFENVDMELDIAAGKLNLYSPDHCPGQVVYWTKTGFATVPLKSSKELGFIRAEVKLDGKLITVALSTVGRSRIGMNAMRHLFNVDETSPDLVPIDQDLLGHKLYRYAFKTLTADGLTITNPAILVYDEEPRPQCNDKLHFSYPDEPVLHSTNQPRLTQCFGGNDAVLGLSVLSKLHLYISGKEKLIYLTSAGAK